MSLPFSRIPGSWGEKVFDLNGNGRLDPGEIGIFMGLSSEDPYEPPDKNRKFSFSQWLCCIMRFLSRLFGRHSNWRSS